MSGRCVWRGRPGGEENDRVGARVIQGDCRELMAAMPGASVDAVVTDPPYGLEFMGKAWDHGVPGVPFWTEALRVLKPGGHLVAFGGTRTHHRLWCAIEDAGFEIRDSAMLLWVYGSGFPKSLDVSKAIDKAAGAERRVIGPRVTGDGHIQNRERGTNEYGTFKIAQDGIDMDTAPATDAARQWDGWGTALKPAYEPILLARKPLAGTVAANVQGHGTGALNVDGCRIEGAPRVPGTRTPGDGQGGGASLSGSGRDRQMAYAADPPSGRWPANVVLDEEAAAMLDAQSGDAGAFAPVRGTEPTKDGFSGGVYGSAKGRAAAPFYGDNGGASRFFYTAKASAGERHYAGKNTHPTVKPVSLTRWLCRLVTPPGGLVLDPFCGSGSTGIAALAEGFSFEGHEQDAEMVAIASRRIHGPLFAQEAP